MRRIVPLLIVVLPLSYGFAPPVELGYVVSTKGTWKDRKHGQQPVRALQPIFSDSELLIEEPTARAYLELRFTDQTTKVYSCKEPALCAGVLPLPALPQKPSGFLTFVLGLLSREGAPPAQLTSRGTSLQDGLVEIRDGQVDLAQVLSTADPDKYQGGWCGLQGKCESPGRTFPLDISRSGPRLVPAPAAGLRRLVVKKPAEDWSAATEAWVLALDGPRYSAAKTRWDQAAQETANWSAQDPNFGALQRLFLRGLAGAPAK